MQLPPLPISPMLTLLVEYVYAAEAVALEILC
jgi:hypothetical protein